MEKNQYTFAGLAVLVLVLVVALAIMITAGIRSIRQANVTGCASNLRSLWQSQFNYAAQYGRPDGAFPEETGVDFWLKLQRTPKPLIDRYEPFICPLSNETPGPGRCSYRGPAFPIRTMSPDDPFAADKEGNHGKGNGGSVLTKTGDCSDVEQLDPLWIRARVTTKE